MAKCFDVTGYIEPCNVVRQKYTGRALLISQAHGQIDTMQGSAVFSNNGVIVTSMFSENDFQTLVSGYNGSGGKAVPVMINAQNPFGVTIQGNTDSGRVSYIKTIPVTIPATRDGKDEEFIMGLQKGFYGSAVIVLESFGLDSVNAINNNDIFGIYSPIHLDPTSVTRSEYENGGAWTFNLVCEEPLPNVICSMTGLNVALDELSAPKQQPAG